MLLRRNRPGKVHSMTATGTCTTPLCIDLTEAAASHAQVVGVLAGFAAGGVAVALARTSTGNDPRRSMGAQHHGIRALFLSFACLVLAAFLYGTAAGGEGSPRRIAAMTLAAGVVTGVAISNLAFGLLGLLAASPHRDLVSSGGRFVATTIPSGATLYVFVSAADVFRVGSLKTGTDRMAAVFLAVLGAGSLAGVCSWFLVSIVLKKEMRTWVSPAIRVAPEVRLIVTSLLVTGAALVYFLVFLYIPAAADAVWTAPLMVSVWLVFMVDLLWDVKAISI
jgi:hypothetical protein